MHVLLISSLLLLLLMHYLVAIINFGEREIVGEICFGPPPHGRDFWGCRCTRIEATYFVVLIIVSSSSICVIIIISSSSSSMFAAYSPMSQLRAVMVGVGAEIMVVVRGNHLSSTTCLTQVFFKSGAECSTSWCSLTRRKTRKTNEDVLDRYYQY